MIYLDNAATTLIKPAAVSRAAGWAINKLSSPGRGGHPAAMAAAEAVYECREKAAQLFNVKDPENIIITSNATHSLNIAIKSLAKPGGRVLVSGYEHNAVTRPLYAAGANVTVAASELFEPEMALHAFESRLTSSISLVVCNHVSNVFGYVLPIERITEVCRSRGIPIIIDASQSAGVTHIDFQKLGADYVAMPGHKGLYGPQGTGLLICASVPEPLLQGGTGGNSALITMPDFLPDKLEAGTHNVPGISGLSAGLDFVLKKGTERILEHEHVLIEAAAGGLTRIDRVRVFASEFGYCQTGVLSFIIEGIPCETAAEELARRGIAVRAGLHCAPLAHKTAETFDTGTVRMSVSAFTTRREVNAFIGAVSDIASR